VTGSRMQRLHSGDRRVPSAEQYIAQGTALGRAGRVHVQSAQSEVWIGGDSLNCIAGTVTL
jgi:predicted PhzF superfamily epimerase YddE/YHI9